MRKLAVTFLWRILCLVFPGTRVRWLACLCNWNTVNKANYTWSCVWVLPWLHSFMWGNFPASILEVGGSTQVPDNDWKKPLDGHIGSSLLLMALAVKCNIKVIPVLPDPLCTSLLNRCLLLQEHEKKVFVMFKEELSIN